MASAILFDRARDPVRARISGGQRGERTDLLQNATSSGDLRARNISRARLIVKKAPDLVEQDQ
jgi:hypothetical protein